MLTETKGVRSSRMHLLLVDDDPRFRSFMKAGLQEFNIDCTTAADALDAVSEFQRAEGSVFDVILLDIMMPGMSGWDLLEWIRKSDPDVPVIFVTARDAIDERVKGLRMGADDYIIKPFAFAELLARIETVVRRRQNAQLELGKLRLDLIRRRAWAGCQTLNLSPKEFDLLRVLMEGAGSILSRRFLLSEVWHTERDPGTNVVEVHVGRLRKKLASAHGPPILTARGSGYVMSPDHPDEGR